MIFFAIILGLPLGVGLSLLLVGSMLNKSNNFGDSKGDLHSFSDTGLIITSSVNKVKKDTPLRGISNPNILNSKDKYKAAPTSPKGNYTDADFNDENLANIKWTK